MRNHAKLRFIPCTCLVLYKCWYFVLRAVHSIELIHSKLCRYRNNARTKTIIAALEQRVISLRTWGPNKFLQTLCERVGTDATPFRDLGPPY
jgi:hypothetical protein